MMDMLGIVIWRSAVSSAAILICADGTSLAFASDINDVSKPEIAPEVGDLVRMRVDDRNGVRKCTHMELVATDYDDQAIFSRYLKNRIGGLRPVDGMEFDNKPANSDATPKQLPKQRH